MTVVGIAPWLGMALAFTVTLSWVARGRDDGPAFAEPTAATAFTPGPRHPWAVADASVPDATSALAVQGAAE